MNKLIISILCIAFSATIFAQRGDKMQERIKAQKVAFITERLDLSADEAQKFWPIYNAFEDKTETIRKTDLKDVRQAMRGGNLTNDEAQTVLEKLIAAEDKLHLAKKQLVNDLKKAISPQKIIALKKTEEDFKNMIIKKLGQRKERMQNRKN